VSAMRYDLGDIDLRDVVVIIMGGGRGTRLYPLTRYRAKPAVGFGGKYRLIDIVLTNCIRSKLEKIFILTQFNSFSLNRHIWQTYSRLGPRETYIDVIAAEQTAESGEWFQGTADAVRKSLLHTMRSKPNYTLILSADQIYSMDYRDLLAWHLAHKADVTLAARYTPESDLHALGVVQVDPALRVVGFCEKPKKAEQVAGFRVDGLAALTPPPGAPYLCSMGIYLFNTPVLLDALSGTEEDFGRSVIPQTAQRRLMSCFPFDGYWEDVGTIEAFYKANMLWRQGQGIAAMFQRGASIITHSRQLPPSRIEGTTIIDSLVADGCHLHAAHIARSIIGVRTRIGDRSVVEDSILMGNDADEGPVPFEVGADCVIRKAILDKDVVVGDGSVIENAAGVVEADSELYSIRSGIVVVPKGAVLPPGTRI